ncbi:hypothetical protein BKA62DRAFT_719420 [Auriculariales sp. MPI-PUGE-AT-0066]|nr:hypothetical protein BKA62DRAFT_719420 [Auriculariales sp. MPI-PUGE-AT-0066]
MALTESSLFALGPSPLAAHLLPELLIEIFSYLAGGPDEATDFNIIRNNRLWRLAPMQVAAVCKTWRSAALIHSPLWHYVAIIWFEDGELYSRYAQYLELILERSRETPIDVIIEFVDDLMLQKYPQILDLVSRHCQRWRAFSVGLRGQQAAHRVRGLLSGMTPRLCTLHLSHQAHPHYWMYGIIGPASLSAVEPNLERFLPHAPQLRHLSSAGVLDLVERHHLDLEQLRFGFVEGPIPLPRECGRVILPKLRRLLLQNEAWQVVSAQPDMLHAPSLGELRISGWSNVLQMRAFLFNISRSVTILGIEQVDLSNADVAPLATLTRLEMVVLSLKTIFPSELLDALCAAASPERPNIPMMWPRLSRLELDNLDLTVQQCDRVVQLNQFRHSCWQAGTQTFEVVPRKCGFSQAQIAALNGDFEAA